jgi:hypothetical protein
MGENLIPDTLCAACEGIFGEAAIRRLLISPSEPESESPSNSLCKDSISILDSIHLTYEDFVLSAQLGCRMCHVIEDNIKNGTPRHIYEEVFGDQEGFDTQIRNFRIFIQVEIFGGRPEQFTVKGEYLGKRRSRLVIVYFDELVC